MKKYKVLASYRTYVYALVEAEDEDQAYDIARDMDGGDFERAKGDDLSDWSIDDVEEVAP
jgi:adenine-specific DNA methylase